MLLFIAYCMSIQIACAFIWRAGRFEAIHIDCKRLLRAHAHGAFAKHNSTRRGGGGICNRKKAGKLKSLQVRASSYGLCMACSHLQKPPFRLAICTTAYACTRVRRSCVANI